MMLPLQLAITLAAYIYKLFLIVHESACGCRTFANPKFKLCLCLCNWPIHLSVCAAVSHTACLCILQERFSGLPESSFPLQDPSQPFPPREQLHSLARQSLKGQPLDRQSLERQSLERQILERQSLERQSLERQVAQAEAALRTEQRQCDALRAQAQQSQGCAMQAQLQLRRSHSRAERLAALVNKADEERRG